jgi:glycosyltransferase involved in cell wall biosynthesis
MPKLTFVVNHVAFFVSHRMPIALRARSSGYDVQLLTGQAGSVSMERLAVEKLHVADVGHQRVAFRSASVNPILELIGLVQLTWHMRKLQPDVVHCASPKGLLYGGLAARFCGVKAVVLAVSGMGFAFTNTGNRSLLRTVVAKVYRSFVGFAFRNKNVQVIVQNNDDKAVLIASGMVRLDQITLIPGSGVNIESFEKVSIESKLPIVLLPARMLLDKGVVEFVQAARTLKAVRPEWRFVLAGAADYHNPSSVQREEIELWYREGIIEWLDHVDDIVPWFVQASIVCLPSYREGMPKALLEAAAAGCAVVTTDTTGCREAIIPGETGDLVPVRDSAALATALLSLITDRSRRERYGYAGQRLAKARFGLNSVIDQTLDIYKMLLNRT